MAEKTDFTDEEWKTLHRGLTGSAMLVSAGHKDFTDSFGEASAAAKELVEQRQQGATPLMRELAATGGTGFGVFASPGEVAETVPALREAVQILSSKAPDEVEPYRALVLELARTVAEAKGGVRPEETAVIDQLRDALGANENAG